MHSLPSPYDPIHHGGRHLDAGKLALHNESLSSDTDVAASATGTASSSRANGPISSVAQTPAPMSMPSSPNTISARRLGSQSFAMENGLMLDSTAEAKTATIQSPTAATDGYPSNGPVDGVQSGSKPTTRNYAYSWAGLNGPALPTPIPMSVQMQAQSHAHTPSGSSFNQPATPRHAITRSAAVSTPLHEEALHMATGSGAAATAPMLNRALVPSVEEVARSVIQQLVLSTPRSQLGLLGLGRAAPAQTSSAQQQMAQNQPQPLSAAGQLASAFSTASQDSANPDALYAHLNGSVAESAQQPMSVPAASTLTPHDSLSSVALAGDGSSGSLANEASLTQSSTGSAPLGDGAGHLASAALNGAGSLGQSFGGLMSLEKNAEQLLDQHLLSSQRVPIYRLGDDDVAVEAHSLSAGYLTRLFGLHGQVAIVTGAARGIGLALARGLAMAGARVCLADMNFEQVARESAMLNEELKQPDATFPLRVDVTKRESIVQLFTTTVERYGLLSICVNNAGLAISGEDPKRNYSESFSEEDFDMTINLNLKAVFFCCQFAARWMIANSVQGSIINVASMSAKVVNWPQRQSVYNASKAAVVQLTKCLAVEWCSYGIRVNSISPGYIDTPLNRQISIAHLRHEWTKKTPQHRLGDPRDLVAAVIYLASSRAAAFTTGEDIIVDGGYTLW